MKNILYVGSYTTYLPAAGERPEGLHVYQMDAGTGHLERIQAVDAGKNPSFLVLSKDGRWLYAANETGDGSVSAFAVDAENGRLRLINRKPVKGDDPCHLSLTPDGKNLLASCYSSGSLAVFPVENNGALGDAVQRIQHAGSGPNAERQDKAHVHCAVPAPGGKFVFVADLGMDRVWVYPIDSTSGRLDTTRPAGMQTVPGAGPRHLAFQPGDRFIYVSNELDSSVTACIWDGENGSLTAFQTLSTLPDDYRVENTVADIHITPDGGMLYVSNRGHDTLAAFKLDAETGHMHRVGFFSSGGQIPRNFAIDPTGRFVLAANQDSSNVVVLRIQADGALLPTGEEAAVLAPVCVVFGKSV